MKISERIALIVLSLVFILNLCACDNGTEATYKTTKKTVLVPETTTETRVVGQRIVGQKTVYLDENENGIIDDFEKPADSGNQSDNNSSDTDSSSSSSGSSSVVEEYYPPMTDNFIEAGKLNYRIIRSSSATNTVMTLTNNLSNSVKSALECTVNFKTDTISPHREQRELLIGETNRPASAYAEKKLRENRSNCYYDAIVVSVGHDICIFGYEKEALVKAAEYFLNTYCDGNTTKAPEDIFWIYEGNSSHTVYPTLKTMTIGGVDISNFRIVVAENPERFALGTADYLQQTIEAAVGVPIDIAYDSAEETEYEIHIGATKRNTTKLSDDKHYNVKLTNGKLCYSANNIDLIYMSLKDLCVGIQCASSAYEIPANYNHTGTYYDLQCGFGGENGYKLVWYDEFDSTIDTTKWRFVEGTSYLDFGKRVSNDDNAQITPDGYLQFIASRKTERIFEASALITEGLAYFKYGYFEVKVKFAGGPGVSNVWWFNSDLGGADRQEIDVYEQFGNQKVLVSNLHSWNVGAKKAHIDHGASSVDAGDWPFNRKFIPAGSELIANNDWRIIGCEWTPDTITMYADGQPFCVWDVRDPEYQTFRNWPVFTWITAYSGQSKSQEIGEAGAASAYYDYFRVYQRDDESSGYVSFVSNNGSKKPVDISMALPTE